MRREFTISNHNLDELIRAHNGDMALLYLYLLREGDADVEKASHELMMPRARTHEAMELLEMCGLLSDERTDSEKTPEIKNESVNSSQPPKGPKPDMRDETFAALVMEMEHIIGHQASVPDLQKLLDIYQNYNLTADVIMLLMNYVAENYRERYGNRRPSIFAVGKEAIRWKKADITNLESAEKTVRILNSSNLDILHAILIHSREQLRVKPANEETNMSPDGYDVLLPKAVEKTIESGSCTVSMVSRSFQLGYSRASRIVDQMEELGVVGTYEIAKPRQVLMDREGWQKLRLKLGL